MVRIAALLIALGSIGNPEPDRLRDMPLFDRYERLRRLYDTSVQRNDFPDLEWADDGQSFTFSRKKKRFTVDLSAESPEPQPAPKPTAQERRKRPERGRQFDTAFSPDKKWKAVYKDRNVWLMTTNGTRERAVTTGGNEQARTKFGVASWVYGEELGVREAMFFSPDSQKLAYYGFDETDVPDFYLTLDETKVQNKLDVEAYPKAGAPNPKVSLFVYDIPSGKTVQVQTSFDSGVGQDLGHYVYNVQWSPSGRELLFNRTSRKQNTMELVAADTETGKCRVVVRESYADGWADNAPQMVWIEEEDGSKNRFVWNEERNGYSNLRIIGLDGKSEKPLTQHKFDVERVLRIDSKKGLVYYTARSCDNPYLIQLHCVDLQGKKDRRLTDPAFTHTLFIDPGCTRIIDTFEALNIPPKTVELDMDGKIVRTISEAKADQMEQAKLQTAERLIFRSADGKYDCYGWVMKPVGFDPTKKVPLIVMVYGGPESGSGSERFVMPNPMSHYGFAVAWFDGRGTRGRGRAFKTAVYRQLGVVEIDDQAEGVKAACKLPWIDSQKVGVTGTSYGGYASVMCILRHPEVFQAAVACSSVTQWLNYDSVYTERYMDVPLDNAEGYKAGSAMEYAQNLKGKLLLFYGTADNNVHPTNTHQLIAALDKANKRYDVLLAPDKGHVAIDSTRMWEFFAKAFLLPNRHDPLARAHRKGLRFIAGR